MGEFFDAIKDDLKQLDASAPPRIMRGHGAAFGTDYNANPTVVAMVQQAINAAGYQPPLTVDGAYGPLTEAGVRWAQGQKGLTQDGIIGDQTLGALGITPPGGASIDSLTGAATSTVAEALAGLAAQFQPLLAFAAKNPQPITQGSGIAPGFQATRASVVNSYVNWTIPFEGWVPFMYLDELGYVTTGMGNKIDSVGEAQALQWTNPDGSPASAQQIADAWYAVDSHRTAPKGQQQNLPGGGQQGGWSSLRISKNAVSQLVSQKMKQNEAHLIAGLSNFAQSPADAQLAAHSMAWAMGPEFAQTWTQFRDAYNASDYMTAAAQSHMNGVGIDMRNLADKLLLTNAALVQQLGADFDHLYYLDGLTQLMGNASGQVMAYGTKIVMSAKKHPLRTAGIAAGVIATVGGILALVFRKG